MSSARSAVLAAALLATVAHSGCSSCRDKSAAKGGETASSRGAPTQETPNAAPPGNDSPSIGTGGPDAGYLEAELATELARHKNDSLCQTLGLDFLEGKSFDPARLSLLLPEDVRAVRRAADEIFLCRATASPDDALCDRTNEPFGCKFQRAVLLDSRKDMKDSSWGALLGVVCASAPGADAAKCQQAREALRAGEANQCPKEWEACAALAAGDPTRCPEEKKDVNECARDATRFKTLRDKGLAGLADNDHDRPLAEAAQGRGSCRWFVDEFFAVCTKATANSELRLRRRPTVNPGKAVTSPGGGANGQPRVNTVNGPPPGSSPVTPGPGAAGVQPPPSPAPAPRIDLTPAK